MTALTAPVEIDTALAAAHEARFHTARSVQWAEADVKREEAALARVTFRGTDGDLVATYRDKLFQAEKTLADAVAADADAIDAITALDRLYTGWNRYFLVNNVGGHIHRSMHCTTCYPTTQYHWLPQLSDCDEAAMVAEYGELACTVCFPDAPTKPGFGDGTSKLARYTAAERDARAAEKATKAAAKAAKAITAPDGTPLRDSHGGVIRTEVTARREMLDYLKDFHLYGYTHHPYDEHAARLAEAIAAKTGESADDLLAAAMAKVEKARPKFEREQAEFARIHGLTGR